MNITLVKTNDKYLTYAVDGILKGTFLVGPGSGAYGKGHVAVVSARFYDFYDNLEQKMAEVYTREPDGKWYNQNHRGGDQSMYPTGGSNCLVASLETIYLKWLSDLLLTPPASDGA